VMILYILTQLKNLHQIPTVADQKVQLGTAFHCDFLTTFF